MTNNQSNEPENREQTFDDECTPKNCNYMKYLSKEVRDLLKKCDAAMWTSGCDDHAYGIEMSPKKFAKFLKAYDKQRQIINPQKEVKK